MTCGSHLYFSLKCGPLILFPTISYVSNLRMFNMILEATIIDDEECFMGSVLEELECLEYLSEMSISLPTVPAVRNFLTYQKLQKCIRNLRINCDGLKEMKLLLSTLQRLRSLVFHYCEHLESVKIQMGNKETGIFSRWSHLKPKLPQPCSYRSCRMSSVIGLDLAYLCSKP